MILQHQQDRHLNLSLYPNIVVCLENNLVSFLIYSFNHRLVGYQQYNPNGDKKERRNPSLGRYYTYLTEPSVWGLESIKPSSPIVFVTEGIFKAVRLHNFGYPAVATLTNNPKSIKKQILNLAPTIIVITDPDEAGTKLKKYGHVSYTPNRPLDELTEFELHEFLYSIKELQ